MARGRRRQLGGVDRLPSGRWRVRLIDPATGKRISIGTHATKAAAEIAFADAISAQQRGGWVAPASGKVTLAEYAEGWLRTRLTARGEPLRPKTLELYDGLLRHHILPTFGSSALSAITTAGVRRWNADLKVSGRTPVLAAKAYRLLRTILTTAVEDGHLVVNPCTIKGAGVEREVERSIPTLDEAFALADAVEPQHRAMVFMAALGGFRRGELLGLTRREIDLLHRRITIRIQRQETNGGEHLITPPKTDAGRRAVKIPASLVPFIEEHLNAWASAEPDGWLFVGERGAPLRICVWERDWRRARKALGLEHVRFHDLRHMAATMAASTGASTKELMHRFGHASSRAALRYQHATEERDEVIADALDDLIAGHAARFAPRTRDVG